MLRFCFADYSRAVFIRANNVADIESAHNVLYISWNALPWLKGFTTADRL
jgi:hypothetical protein